MQGNVKQTQRFVKYPCFSGEKLRNRLPGYQAGVCRCNSVPAETAPATKSYHGYGNRISLAIIETDSGFKGWGCFGRYGSGPADTGLLVGKPLSELFAAETGILDESLGLFDIALHDLAGRILGIPVAKMIQPGAVLKVPVYDGAIYMNDIIPEEKPYGVQKILEECAYDYDLGHRAFKIKIGRGFKWM